MKPYLYFLTKQWLLLLCVVLIQLKVQAQGLELFPLTRADKAQNEKVVPAPPKVPVLENYLLLDHTLNLQLAETAPKAAPSDIPGIDKEIQRVEDAFQTKAAIRNSLKTGKTEDVLKKDSAYQLISRQINTLEVEKKQLQQQRNTTIRREAENKRAGQQTRNALLRQLSLINDAHLNRARPVIAERNTYYQQSLAASKIAIDTIRKYQDTYWASEPDPLLVGKEVKQDARAYRQFAGKLTQLERHLGAASAAYTDFKTAKDRIDKYRLNVADTLETARLAYNQHIATIQRTDSITYLKVDTLRAALTAYNQLTTKWQASFKSAQDKKTASNNNLTALPALTSIKGASLYIPAVSVIGSHRGGSDESPTIYSLKLFTALGGGDTRGEVPSRRGTERLFIPDASTFGFSANAAFAFTHASRKTPTMGVVIGAAYLDKLMTPDSLISFTAGTVSARVQLELYLIADVLMVYGGFNSLTFLTNRDQVTQYYTNTRPKDVYGFANAGVRAILKPGGEKSGVSFLFDLGFVLKGDNVKTFVPNDDFTITTIRATIAKNFALN